MKLADKILEEGAQLFRDRNRQYGNTFLHVGNALAALFPAGIEIYSADDFNRFQIINQIVNKLSRYSCNWESGGHADSIFDIMVYAAMLAMIDESISQRGADDANL